MATGVSEVRKLGRPSKYSAENVAKVQELFAAGWTVRAVARHFEVADTTIWSWVRRSKGKIRSQHKVVRLPSTHDETIRQLLAAMDQDERLRCLVAVAREWGRRLR